MAKMFQEEVFAEYPKQVPTSPMAISGSPNNLFFTSFRGNADTNYQLNYALNGDLYYYIFGDKVGMAQLDGIAIPTQTICKGLKVGSTAADFVNFYKAHRLGQTNTPTRITVGGMVWSGYFVSLSVNLVAGKENTYMFSLGFLSRVN